MARTGSQASEFSGVTGESEELFQRRLKTQEKLLNLAHRTEIKNTKALAIQDASIYVRESMDKLIKVMSREHR